MKRFSFLVPAVSAVLLWAGSAAAQQPTQPYLFGVWQGTMTEVPQVNGGEPMTALDQGNQFEFQLDIRDTNMVFAFRNPEGGWDAIGEGADLRLNQAGRSATVIAAMSDADPSRTWMINVMRWDEETVVVYLSQIVSDGGGQPPSSFGAIGQMRRVSQ